MYTPKDQRNAVGAVDRTSYRRDEQCYQGRNTLFLHNATFPSRSEALRQPYNVRDSCRSDSVPLNLVCGPCLRLSDRTFTWKVGPADESCQGGERNAESGRLRYSRICRLNDTSI